MTARKKTVSRGEKESAPTAARTSGTRPAKKAPRKKPAKNAAPATPSSKKAPSTVSRGVTKQFLKTRPGCKVTFRVPPQEGGKKAAVAGDFSDWKPLAMKGLKGGGFSLTVELPTGESYQYRYLVDGERWCNDWQADEYVKNRFGCDNSLINL